MAETPKLELIFVDDELNVLAGYRRSMARMRKQWVMRFAAGADEALQMFQERAADVVVADIRMPGIDGLELMSRVRNLYPRTVRIILSGGVEKESLFRALDCSDQYLTKPCEPEALQAVIEQVRNAQTHLDSNVVRSLVANAGALPQLPDTYRRLVEALDDPSVGTRDVARILSEDLVVSTQALRLVNSALFSPSREVGDIETAVALLGIETIRGIILSHGLFEHTANTAGWLDAQELRDHSFAVAATARWLGELDGLSTPQLGELFIASILHDIGLLVMAGNSTGPTRLDPPDLVAELETFGANRYSIGAYLLTVWGFPTVIVDAVARMADPTIPMQEGLAWRLRVSHELVLRLGLTTRDLPRDDHDDSDALMAELHALRPLEAASQ